MKKKITISEVVERPIKAVIFGDNGYARGVCGRILQKANDENNINANAVMIRDNPGDKNIRQFNRFNLLFKRGAKETLMDVNCINEIIDGFNDYNRLSALADNSEITTVLWAPEKKNWINPDGTIKNTNDNLLAQLTMMLFRRFCLEMHGFEVILLLNEDHNGEVLKGEIIEYAHARGLNMDFINWLTMEVNFINAFVETRVGAQKIDAELTINVERYFLCVFDKESNLLKNAKFIAVDEELSGYYTLRTHIYEGALCSACAYSLLHEVLTLDAFMFREKLVKQMTVSVFEEIVPVINVNFQTAQAYTVEMLQRFEDASVTVKWRDYAENLGDKFKKSIIPVIKNFYKLYEKFPKHLVFALFCTLKLYSVMNINDGFSTKLKISKNILKDKTLWGEDISYLQNDLEAFEKKVK
ncbi:MAG: hypothetical protein E7365_03590 [Clostridiales bacterium]|nr:hypothetical protein [Clostridiales bacterium]